MTEQDIKRSLNLVRYGGIVVTVVVFIALLGFSLLPVSMTGANGQVITGNAYNNGAVPYILGITVVTAILAVVLYFVYRAYLQGRLTNP